MLPKIFNTQLMLSPLLTILENNVIHWLFSSKNNISQIMQFVQEEGCCRGTWWIMQSYRHASLIRRHKKHGFSCQSTTPVHQSRPVACHLSLHLFSLVPRPRPACCCFQFVCARGEPGNEANIFLHLFKNLMTTRHTLQKWFSGVHVFDVILSSHKVESLSTCCCTEMHSVF